MHCTKSSKLDFLDFLFLGKLDCSVLFQLIQLLCSFLPLHLTVQLMDGHLHLPEFIDESTGATQDIDPLQFRKNISMWIFWLCWHLILLVHLYCRHSYIDSMYSVSPKKITSLPYDCCQFLPNGWEFLIKILHTYYVFKCTIDCQILSNYLQISQSYAVLSATTPEF